jgi:hypothetical protein
MRLLSKTVLCGGTSLDCGHFRDRLIKIASGVEKNEPHLGVDFEPRTSRKDQMNESMNP